MKRALLVFALTAFILAGCSLSPTTEEGENLLTSAYFTEDSTGNLLTINYSGQRLVLYNGETLVKVLPTSSEEFLINVETTTGETDDLKVYRYSEVEADLENPDPTKLLLRWNIPLNADTALVNRVTWLIDPENITTSDPASGYGEFAYSGNDYNVDVFINSRTGAKLGSFSPGSRRKVGLPYGNYKLFYRYWESDNTNAEGINEIGWVEKEYVNNQEVDIWMVLSEARKNQYLVIPTYGSNAQQDVQYGKITITNSTATPVEVYLDSDTIMGSSKLYYNPEASNNGTIEANGSREYLLVEGSGYNFSVKTLEGVLVDQATHDIDGDTPVTWIADNN